DRANNYAIIQHNRYQTSVCEVCLLAPISLSCLNPDEIDYVPNSSLDLSNTFVVIGSELVICHAEHPTVKKQIPPDKALLVSIQRWFLNKRIDDRIDD
ncbi:MAG: hypothetical protein WBY71_06800, partial [Nitrososphaeraceae archaeon]